MPVLVALRMETDCVTHFLSKSLSSGAHASSEATDCVVVVIAMEEKILSCVDLAAMVARMNILIACVYPIALSPKHPKGALISTLSAPYYLNTELAVCYSIAHTSGLSSGPRISTPTIMLQMQVNSAANESDHGDDSPPPFPYRS